jgi:hypothetical protein
MTRTRREALIATALLAAIAGATLAQVLDWPSPQPSPPVHAYYLMPVTPPLAPARVPGLPPRPLPPRS